MFPDTGYLFLAHRSMVWNRSNKVREEIQDNDPDQRIHGGHSLDDNELS